jgi:hypothetical protein
MENERSNVKVVSAAEIGWEDGKIVGNPAPLTQDGIDKLLGKELANRDVFVNNVTGYPPYTELWRAQTGEQPERYYLVEIAAEQ